MMCVSGERTHSLAAACCISTPVQQSIWFCCRAEPSLHGVCSMIAVHMFGCCNQETGALEAGAQFTFASLGLFMVMQGLLHISDMSWDHVAVPEDVVQPGDEIQCKIKAVDKERQRIYFSLKLMEVCLHQGLSLC